MKGQILDIAIDDVAIAVDCAVKANYSCKIICFLQVLTEKSVVKCIYF